MVGSETYRVREDVLPHAVLERVGWHPVNAGVEQSFELAAQADEREQANAWAKVDEQVDVTVLSLLTTGDAAKDSEGWSLLPGRLGV